MFWIFFLLIVGIGIYYSIMQRSQGDGRSGPDSYGGSDVSWSDDSSCSVDSSWSDSGGWSGDSSGFSGGDFAS